MGVIIGRYAPSPSGDLHFGSLVAAIASYCHTKSRGGLWRLRIDDLDTPRVVPGAAGRIIDTLAAFGLRHDGPIMYQSDRAVAYDSAIARLKRAGHAFDCGCTRREARRGPPGPEGPIYPGTCRNGLPPGRTPRSIRCRVRAGVVPITDQLQGELTQDLAMEIGDFVIRRADGIVAYQLATVVDDAAQGVTEVVRGVDLLSSSPRQRWLQHCLGLPETRYLHVPLIVDTAGEKLGKSNGALALDTTRRETLIRHALQALGHDPPRTAHIDSVEQLISWAVTCWQSSAIPRSREVALSIY